jgi:hypothetical protein
MKETELKRLELLARKKELELKGWVSRVRTEALRGFARKIQWARILRGKGKPGIRGVARQPKSIAWGSVLGIKAETEFPCSFLRI